MSRLLPLVIALALAACGGEGEGAGASGIRGRALAGPQCPVEIAGSPCPDLPFDGTVIATNVATGDVATVETDADGRFRLSLPPGTYEVSIVSQSPPPIAKPQTVEVEREAFTAITVAVDTGIR